MKIILDNWRFRKYFPEYDVKDKILFLKGKMPVEELIELKLIIKMYNLDVKDIRIN